VQENEPLNAAASASRFEELAATINDHHVREGLPVKSVDEIAYGFVKVCCFLYQPTPPLYVEGHCLGHHTASCSIGMSPSAECIC
jgi:hypothetical protein